jgi:HEAT repeat protein
MMASPEYERLNRQLAEAGVPEWFVKPGPASLEIVEPVAVLVNSRLSVAPYEEILVAALPSIQGAELEMAVRALSERGLKRAGPVLVQLMASLSESSVILWAFGNAIATIGDPATFDAVVALCSDRRLGLGRQMLFSLLPRIGTDAAYGCAIDALDDDSVRGHAIEAVGRFGRPEAIPLLDSTATRPGLWEHRAKATALRRLERVTSRPAKARQG